MIFFYSLAMVPILVGLVLWAKNREVIWWEWLASSALAFLMAGLFHWMAIQAQCRDHETFSGRMVYATHHPYWQAREEVDDYEDREDTDSDGNKHTHRVKVGSHYEYTDHPEFWDCEADFGGYIGTRTYEITREFFLQVANNFCAGRLDVERPHKPDFHKGDRNEYVARNKTDYWYPMTTQVAFQNRVKACPSLYSYASVPSGAKVFEYPKNGDPFRSDRLVGTASRTISTRAFDILCGRLGPSKKVNLIMVGFGDLPSDTAHLQEAAWVGGKKNDLVLCYGGPDPYRPQWSYVFGWTERAIVKANLQTLLIGNKVDDALLPMIRDEVARNYEIKDWKKFSYLQVDPPPWSYWAYILAMILFQGGFWVWASVNEFDKDGTGFRADFGRRFRDGIGGGFPSNFGGMRWRI
jgi:hypothetical protein